MAKEIKYSLQLSAIKGGASVSLNASGSLDMTGDDMIQTTQVIGTTAELVDLGEITGTPAMIAIQNLDATNFVEIGGESGLTVFKLKIPPLKATLFSPTSGILYAQADTAACRIMVVAAES